MSTTNNKRIVKNTILLYLRMLLSIVVSLYTSRVVLQTLGVEDYGIYGLVGGVVAMFAFLNATMSGATSRFITFSLGKGEEYDTQEMFCTALILHIGIALVIILLAETVGLWFLEEKLVIPVERMNAARIVYQFSILAMAIQITQVPYNASIISYEKMDVYAYVELLNVFLKLGIVYLLNIGNFDKLILYAFLVLTVNIIVASTYRIYCIKHFNICKFHWIIDKKKFLPMLSFSGWDLYGNMCYTARQQGINMLINMFFGVALNAASSVATSVQGVVTSLSANVVQAFRPQIIKQYAQNNYHEMEKLMCNSVKFSVLLFCMIGVPLCYEIYPIMHLWLGVVPSLAPEFCIFLMAISLLNLINSILCIAIHATGHIKYLSIVTGTIYLLTVPATYIMFKYFTDNSILAYAASLVSMIMVVLSNAIIVKHQIPTLAISRFGVHVLYAFFLVALALPSLYFSHLFESKMAQILVSFISYILALIIIYLVGLDKEKRSEINSMIIRKLQR